MKIKTLGIVCFLFITCALLAQPQTVSTSARVSFEQRWPAADPQWFELTVQPDGSATYRSLPHQDAKTPPDDPDPDPFEFSFTMTPESRRLIFLVAPELRRFEDTLDKNKVAFTGKKTLKYEDGTGVPAVLTYNYSSAPELAKLTDLFQQISQTIGLLQTLGFQSRFDKLALDATLKQAEEMASFHRIAEPQILDSILQRISNDSSVMNIARLRAHRILRATQQK